MMRITPFTNGETTDDFETLEIVIKAIPFQDTYAPVFYISSPSEDYLMNIDELACLMDGIDIARRNVDDIIDFLLKGKKE
mgnify:CR=1 FL=1